MTKLTFYASIALGVIVLSLTVFAIMLGQSSDHDVVVAVMRTKGLPRDGERHFMQLLDLQRGDAIEINTPVQDTVSITPFDEGRSALILYSRTEPGQPSEYGIRLYDLSSGNVTSIYDGSSTRSFEVSGLWSYNFGVIQDGAAYVLADPVTSEVFVIDADTREQRSIYQPESGFNPVASVFAFPG